MIVEYPCSLNPLFTSVKYEFVSAYQLIRDHKVPNSVSDYEAIIRQAVCYGMREEVVRTQLEYMILTDFILSNVDRHFNNFGFLYDPARHSLIAMAPIFDTGNSLFYNSEMIPSGQNLLEIAVSSFCKREVDMLRYVEHMDLFCLDLLDDFPQEAEEMFEKYTDMPVERAEAISHTIGQKLEYLRAFRQGKKIWKRKKYW